MRLSVVLMNHPAARPYRLLKAVPNDTSRKCDVRVKNKALYGPLQLLAIIAFPPYRINVQTCEAPHSVILNVDVSQLITAPNAVDWLADA